MLKPKKENKKIKAEMPNEKLMKRFSLGKKRNLLDQYGNILANSEEGEGDSKMVKLLKGISAAGSMTPAFPIAAPVNALLGLATYKDPYAKDNSKNFKEAIFNAGVGIVPYGKLYEEARLTGKLGTAMVAPFIGDKAFDMQEIWGAVEQNFAKGTGKNGVQPLDTNSIEGMRTKNKRGARTIAQYALGTGIEGIDPPKKIVTGKSSASTFLDPSTMDIIENKESWDTKPIVKYQPGVTSGPLGKQGFYLYSKNPTQSGFNADTDREFINQESFLDVQRTPQWKAYMKGQGTPPQQIAQYAMGSGAAGVIKGYMPDPNEVFAQNSIDIAKAQYEASTNPWVQGGKALGGAAMGIGMNMFSGAGGFGALKTDIGKLTAPKAAMGTGPQGASGVPIETEEGEVLETPEGQITQENGQKHTEGGNQKVVAPGTTIFSDQIKVEGKTMAERKLARERNMKRLSKAVERDASDALAKNTLKQTSEKYKIEEQQDLEVQEYASQLDDQYDYAMGTGKYGVQKFDTGGIVGPDPYVASTFLNNFGELTPEQIAMNRLNKGNTEIERHFGSGDLNTSNYEGINLKQFAPQSQQNSRVIPTQTSSPVASSTGTPGDAAWVAEDDAFWANEKKVNPAGFVEPYASANANFSLGDVIGMGSSLYGGFAQSANTKANRANTVVNKNEYRDFGIDALKANEDATAFLGGQQEKALQDINLSATGAITANRNTARGVNQNRAMDAGVFVNANKAKANVFDNFSKQMMTQLNAKAGLENTQDQYVMQGALTAKGLNDEDTDNYYSQRGADIAGLSNMGMNLGKQLNVSKGNQDFLNMLPDLTSHGLGYTRGANGKLMVQKITT